MLIAWIFALVGAVVGLGIGGLFINGTFLNTILLDLLPQIVHTVVGWIIIGSTLLALTLNVIDTMRR